MIVEIDINVVCPVCGFVMTRFKNFVTCKSQECKNFDVKFEKPTIQIHRIIEEAKL
jgi:hypothetical protein